MRPIWVLILALVVIGAWLAGCSKPEEDCLGAEPHPIGTNVAANYGIDYSQVMDWYCQEYAFDDIILALETVDLAPEYSTADLLQMKSGVKNWEEIWQVIGLTD